MDKERHILLVSKANAPWLGALRSLAKAERWPISAHAKTLDALTWLDQNQPRAIVIDGTVSRALTLCVLARAKPLLADVPILGLVPVVDDTAYSRWLAVGVDDVVPATAPSRLVDRLRSLPADRSIRPPPDRGLAVVADSDPARCDVVGRVLAHAGYDVRLALDATRLVEYASEPDVQLVIASTVIGEPNSLILRARKGATLPAWVVGDPALEPWANPRPYSTVERAVIMSARAQPDAVLFASNALLLACGRKARGSTRLLYGTTVVFRVKGKVGDEYGYTFNVSATGLFVRTLAAPPSGEITFELDLPGSGGRQKLHGEVIWNRPFGNQPGATTPPGFGVRLLEEPKAAMDGWRRAYEKLAATSGVPPMETQRPEPKSEPGELAGAITGSNVLVQPLPRPRSVGVTAGESRAKLPKLPLPKTDAPTPRPPKPPSLPLPPPPSPPLSKSDAPEPKSDAPKPPSLPLPPLPTLDAPKPPLPTLGAPKLPLPTLDAPKPPLPTLDTPKPPAQSLPTPAPLPLDAGLPQPAPNPVAEAVVQEPAAIEAPAPLEIGTTVSTVEAAVGVSAPTRADRKLPLILLTAALGVVALGVGGWVFLGESESSTPAVTSNPRPEPTSSAIAAPPPTASSTLPAAASEAPIPSPPDSASATPPAASSSAPPVATAPASGACPQSTPGDGEALLSYQGYLIVCSSASLDVYASGVLLGKTNEKLVARCHLKFVRLGEGSPAVWRTDGKTVDIACREVTRVTIDPTP